MERNTKRIVAVVAIAAIAIGGGVGAWILLQPPSISDIVSLYYEVPGAPANVNPNNVIRVGVLGDMGAIWGDQAYQGALLAAKDINTAGGIVIENSTDTTTTPNGRYYIGIAKEDTDEQSPELQTSRGISAAQRMIYTKQAQFCVGGSRTEALAAYLPTVLSNDVMFLDTGASDDIFCEHVLDSATYPDYDKFFRVMPINSTALGSQIVTSLISFVLTANATHPNKVVRRVGLIYEDLAWTDALVAGLPWALNNYSSGYIQTPGFGVPTSSLIKFDPGVSSADILTSLNQFSSDSIDILIPLISGPDAIKMTTQWADLNKTYMLAGIDVPSQTSEYWTDTGGRCAYEIGMQAVTRTNKTDLTIAFWDAFNSEYGHDPIYTACGSYDAIKLYAYGINGSQSIDVNDVIAELETIDVGNPKVGVGGVTAFLASHDLMAGAYPLGITLWAQWRSDGSKVCVPAPAYAAAGISDGNIEYPPWIETAWA